MFQENLTFFPTVFISFLLFVSDALADADCAKFSAAECYRAHFSICVLERSEKGYFCREPLDSCERNWRHDGRMDSESLKQACESISHCAYVPRGCLCPCDLRLPEEQKCLCECGGGLPGTCREKK